MTQLLGGCHHPVPRKGRKKVTQLDIQLRKNMDLPIIQRHTSAKDQAEPWRSNQRYQLVWAGRHLKDHLNSSGTFL